MKVKRILAVFLAVLMLTVFVSCNSDKGNNISDESSQSISSGNNSSTENSSDDSSSTEPIETREGPLLYKVSDKEGNIVWLFGSIHVGKSGFYPLPEYVTEAFEGSERLAVEFDIVAYENDMSAQMESLTSLIYTDGTTVKNVIPSDLYTEAKKILVENNVYNAVLDYYLPIMWSSFIDNVLYEKIGADSSLGVDRHLINSAKNSNKEIIDIESAEFQYKMMASFSKDLQIELLKSSVESYKEKDEVQKELKEMMDLWHKGDEKNFAAMLNEPPEFENDKEKVLYQEYTDAMTVNRNISMAKFAEDALKSGKETFICVGAAHVVGDGAMADLLAKKGYTVEIVR